jgi:plastocyanin
MRKEGSHAIQMSAIMCLILAGAIALQVSCTRWQHMVGSCSVSPNPLSVTVGVANGVLGVSPDPVQACPGDKIAWSRASGTDTNTYTVQFGATADPCGWNGASQNIPVTCDIPNSAAGTGSPGDKYTSACASGSTCSGVAPLDPHVIIMGR